MAIQNDVNRPVARPLDPQVLGAEEKKKAEKTAVPEAVPAPMAPLIKAEGAVAPPPMSREAIEAFVTLSKDMGEVAANVTLSKRAELDLSALATDAPAPRIDQATISELTLQSARGELPPESLSLFEALMGTQNNFTENTREGLKDTQKTALTKLAAGLSEVVTQTLPVQPLSTAPAVEVAAFMAKVTNQQVVVPSGAFVKVEGLMSQTLPDFAGMDIEMLVQLVMLEIGRDASRDLQDLITEVQKNNRQKQAARAYETKMKQEKARVQAQLREEYDERCKLPSDNPSAIDPKAWSFEDYAKSRNVDASFAEPPDSNGADPRISPSAQLPLQPRAAASSAAGEVSDAPPVKGSPEAEALLAAHRKEYPPLDLATAERIVTIAKELNLTDESGYRIYCFYKDSQCLQSSPYAVPADMSFEDFVRNEGDPALGLKAVDAGKVFKARVDAVTGVNDVATRAQAVQLYKDITVLEWTVSRMAPRTDASIAQGLKDMKARLTKLQDGMPAASKELLAQDYEAAAAQFVQDVQTSMDINYVGAGFEKKDEQQSDDYMRFLVLDRKMLHRGDAPEVTADGGRPNPLGAMLLDALTRALGGEPPAMDGALIQRMSSVDDPLSGAALYYGFVDTGGIDYTAEWEDEMNSDSKHKHIKETYGSWGTTKRRIIDWANQVHGKLYDAAAGLRASAKSSGLNPDGKPLFSREDGYKTTRRDLIATIASRKLGSDESKPTLKNVRFLQEAAQAQGDAPAFIAQKPMTFGELDVATEKWGNYKDSLADMGEELHLEMQMYMDRRQKTFSLLSNLIKSWSDTRGGIIANTK